MKFWNYIGEFFLLRWLFGSHKHNETKRDVPNTNISPADKDFANEKDSHIEKSSEVLDEPCLKVRTPQKSVLYSKSPTCSPSNICYNCIDPK